MKHFHKRVPLLVRWQLLWADEVDDLFVKIANQQLFMQRIHAKCINEVQEVLNNEQYAKLIEILKLGIEND